MALFHRVSNGNVTDASDINQILDVLTGVTTDQPVNIVNQPPGPGQYVARAELKYHNQNVGAVTSGPHVTIELDGVATGSSGGAATYDPSGMFNSAGHYFTIPQSGYWMLAGRASLSNVNSASSLKLGTARVAGGTTYYQYSGNEIQNGGNLGVWMGGVISDLRHFNQGDRVYMTVGYSTNGGVLISSPVGETWMGLHLVATTGTLTVF